MTQISMNIHISKHTNFAWMVRKLHKVFGLHWHKGEEMFIFRWTISLRYIHTDSDLQPKASRSHSFSMRFGDLRQYEWQQPLPMWQKKVSRVQLHANEQQRYGSEDRGPYVIHLGIVKYFNQVCTKFWTPLVTKWFWKGNTKFHTVFHNQVIGSV